MRKNLLLTASVVFIFVFPLVVMSFYAVSSQWRFPQVIPQTFDSHGLTYVADQLGPILKSLGSSLAYSLAAVVLSLAMCVLPASVFARRRFPLKGVLEGLLLAPALVPPMTFSMGVHYAFIKAGLADTHGGVILVLTVFAYPYMLRALVVGFSSYGEEYDICARNLGAGLWVRLVRVDLPLLVPAVVAGGSVVFLVAFSEYFLVFLIGGGTVPSFAGYLFPFLNSSDRSVASVLTLVFLLVPVILFFLVESLVQRKYRKKGIF